MDQDKAPASWIGQEVAILLRDVLPTRAGVHGSETFEQRRGTLVDVSELGATVNTSRGVQFFPWTSIRYFWPS